MQIALVVITLRLDPSPPIANWVRLHPQTEDTGAMQNLRVQQIEQGAHITLNTVGRVRLHISNTQ